MLLFNGMTFIKILLIITGVFLIGAYVFAAGLALYDLYTTNDFAVVQPLNPEVR